MPTNRSSVEVPPRICLACFNSQQQFAFPFLVYCEHHTMLAVVHGRNEHATFACEPKQLEEMVRQLQRGEMPEQSSRSAYT